MIRAAALVALAVTVFATTGCQNPTDPDDVVAFDDVVDVSASPSPIAADTVTSGRTYRVVRGNNQPDEILAYDWHAVFTTNLTFSNEAVSDDVDVTFPVRITSTTITVKQASGGIVTTPTGGDSEKYDFVIAAGSNVVNAVNVPVATTFEVWYDLPSLRKEAVITVTFMFTDADGVAYQKSEDFSVGP